MVENLLFNIKQGYLNCMLPCNDFLNKSIKKTLNLESKVIERNDSHLILELKDKPNNVQVEFTFRRGINDRLCVNDIIIK